MNKTIDNETLLLKVESFEHRIEVLENTLKLKLSVSVLLVLLSSKMQL